MVNYFWDSYAIIELIHGNQNYSKYINEPVVLTRFNLVEIYWTAIHEYSEKEANELFEVYKEAVVESDDETLKEAVKFRKKYKKQNISYTDAIGYIYSLRNNLKFLTGDNQFKDFENVEFVK